MAEETPSTTREWLAGMSAEERDRLFTETDQGVFGLEQVVEDFDERDLQRLRMLGNLVRSPEREGVRSAIALAGSAAQSKFQLFPGDCDLFERVHISAPTREAAQAILVSLMIETIARLFPHPDLQFSEMKLGLHAADRRRGDEAFSKGSPISWSLSDVDARSMAFEEANGAAVVVEIGEAAEDPGFVKLDWVFADAENDRIVPVSKVIDPTWERPDGTVVALDGVLDNFYQEVYLDPETRPFVEQMVNEVKPAGMSQYTEQLEKEIRKYTSPGHENYGKVAKRLYNILRVTNRMDLAVRLRGVFDDPDARLYQIEAALHALEPVLGRRRLSGETVREDIEHLQQTVRECYDGDDRDHLIDMLGRLPEMAEAERSDAMGHISDQVNREVSAHFRSVMEADPEVWTYLQGIVSEPG